MKTLMIIETTHGGIFFSLTYLAAFLMAAGIMIYEGTRRGYPRSAWLLILLSGMIFFIIGEKVFTYSQEQWAQVFTGFHFPDTNKKTVLGGIIGLYTGLLLAKTWLRFKRPVLDTMAIVLPLGMAISRIGCLMAGCCFGTPTNLPWGIRYDAASWAYHIHLSQGLVQLHDGTSLAVHPAQLYQVIGCLIIAFIVWKTRKQWKSNGSLFLFSVLGYAALRFFVEFVRAPESSFFAVQIIWGLKSIQWLIMGAFISGLFILIIREKKGKAFTRVPKIIDPTNFRQFVLTSILCIIVISARKWFSFLEFSTILLFLIPVLMVLSVKLYRRYFVTGFRWVVPVLLISCFSFMAQKSIPTGEQDDKILFTEVGLSGMVGSYYDNLKKVTGEDCGDYITAPVGTDRITFYQGGMDFSFNRWHGKYNKLAVGARGFVGSEKGEIVTDYPHSKLTYGISPFFKVDWRWFGLGTGFTVGQMKIRSGLAMEFSNNHGFDRPNHKIGDIISADYFNKNFVFSVSARVGPYDIFYMEGSYPGLFPSTTPFPQLQVGFGSGLGKTNGTKVAIGVCDDGFYTELNYPFKNNIVVKAFYADNFFAGIKSKRVLSLGISYRLMIDKTAPKRVLD